MPAILRLKKRIMLLLCLLTGTVLLAACLLACQLSVRQITDGFDAVFEAQFSSFLRQIQNRSAIDPVELRHFEQENGVVLQIYENGAAVVPALPPISLETGELLALAEANFLKAGSFGEMAGRFTVQDGKKGSWRGEYQVVQGGARAWYGLLMLKTEAAQEQALQKARLRYAGIFLGALLALLCISYVLARMAAGPTQRAYRRQLEFTAAAGHDLRTPVAIIKSSAQLICQNPAQAPAGAEKIVQEADRLARLVDDLLMLAAGEAGRLDIKTEHVDMESLLISLYEQFTPLATQNGLSLRLLLPENILPAIKGDADRITQILSAFLSNAFEYGKDGECVELVAQTERRHLLVKVVDHGAGLKQEDKQLVFHQFYRADKSRSQKEHFGLGLSIAQKLALAQGAVVLAEDTVGGGASFVLRLKRP